ncbi:DUF2281 domain-containing protein [Persicitalea sp.]|uniref:type II toxin-antitoxin system VapB family antitoxin n=1 Tax=Persicitalea sp. TaxID=3100273 RepID=UPI0035931322
MADQEIHSKLSLLHSQQLKQDLLDYLDGLLARQIAEEQSGLERKPRFGCAKGKFHMSDDFDAPLDDFKDYMPE